MSDLQAIILSYLVISTAFSLISLFLFRREIDNTVAHVAEAFQTILVDPTVRKGFGIAGKASGESRAKSAVVDELATDMMDSPQFAGIKMGADLLGVDMDSYISKHGAVGTLQGLTQIAGMLGIDVNQLLASGMSGIDSSSSGAGNPYLNGGKS